MRVGVWAVLFVAWGWVSEAVADDRLEEIRRAVADEGLEWSAGMTAVARLSPVERERRLVHSGVVWPVGQVRPSAASFPAKLPAPPGALDWRNLQGFGFLPPVRDQGACGSCWAFAVLGAFEPLVAHRASRPNPTLDLSEQHLLSCAASSLGCDSGGLTWGPPGAFLIDEGVTEERCYPYLSGESGERGLCGASNLSEECRRGVVRAARAIELVETMPGFPQWNPPDFELSAEATERIKGLLATRPVGVTMRVFDDFHYYRGGIYSPTSAARRDGLHSVVLVGYDDAGGWWIGRNSWGEDWGEEGYFRIRYGSSSIGMYAFAFEYDEQRAVPAFCADLPRTLALDGDDPGVTVELKLANCGGGVLAWKASFDQEWLSLESSGGAPIHLGREVAAGSTYRLRLSRAVGPDARAILTLAGGEAGVLRIAVGTGGLGAPVEPAGPNDSNEPVDVAEASLEESEPSSGCGCAASTTLLPGMGLLALGALSRRRIRSR